MRSREYGTSSYSSYKYSVVFFYHWGWEGKVEDWDLVTWLVQIKIMRASIVYYVDYCLGLEPHPLKIKISYSLEQPKGGVMFVVPPGGTSEAMVWFK